MKKAICFILAFAAALSLAACAFGPEYDIIYEGKTDVLAEPLPASARAGEKVEIRARIVDLPGQKLYLDGEELEPVSDYVYYTYTFTMPARSVVIRSELGGVNLIDEWEIAYLGFLFESSEIGEPPMGEILAVYPQFAGAVYVDAGGDDLFAIGIFAPYEIYRKYEDAEGAEHRGELLYSGAGPVILRCNTSDIVQNTAVCVGGGFRFSPFISLADGRAVAPGCKDVTVYPAWMNE